MKDTNADRKPASPIADSLADSTPPDSITTWLSRLNVLLGVPFHHLVCDERLLEPESIKFFQIDPAWLGALLDGALSIGRHYTQTRGAAPALIAEQVHRPRLHTAVHAATREIRRWQLKKAPSTSVSPGGTAARGPVTGFLLRSKVVSGWKSMDVVGYARGSSPYDNEQGRIAPGQVQALDALRIEHLSATVLFGLFSGQLYQLVLHQPPEAIHFGFQTVNSGGNGVTKNLRVPTSNWDDPDTAYDTQTYQHQSIPEVFTDATHRVVNLAGLSRVLAKKLHSVGKAPGYYQASPDANHKNHLLSSDFALEMVQGVGLVSFINNALPTQDLA